MPQQRSTCANFDVMAVLLTVVYGTLHKWEPFVPRLNPIP